MTVRETIIAKILAAGYDSFDACDEADRIITEFKASGKKRDTFGIMSAGQRGKCVDVVTIERADK